MPDDLSSATSPFGARLRQWRRHRGLSQLALAGQVASTPRHVSFLETGRSRPSRDTVLRLAGALEVPLREVNELLQAAGLAPAYPEAALQAPTLEPFRQAIDRLLAAHEPFPALVLDAHGCVVAANRASAALFGGGLVGTNLLERYLADAELRAAVVNWPEIAWTALDRLRKQLGRTPFDSELRRLVTLAEAAVTNVPRPQHGDHGVVVCPWFRSGDSVIRTFALAARFDTATDITLDELRIELIYPQDTTAERFFRERQPAERDGPQALRPPPKQAR
jgi:transcriptional regulator with XRE-family HTH domain